MNWPFEDPENVAVFTSTKVIKEKKPILYVSHDEEDGAWQFHTGDLTDVTEAMVISLAEIYKHDKSIGLLANLPYGYVAERESISHEWIIHKKT